MFGASLLGVTVSSPHRGTGIASSVARLGGQKARRDAVVQGEHLVFCRFHEEELLHFAQLIGHRGCEIAGLRVVLGDVIQFPFEAVDHVGHLGQAERRGQVKLSGPVKSRLLPKSVRHKRILRFCLCHIETGHLTCPFHPLPKFVLICPNLVDGPCALCLNPSRVVTPPDPAPLSMNRTAAVRVQVCQFREAGYVTIDRCR